MGDTWSSYKNDRCARIPEFFCNPYTRSASKYLNLLDALKAEPPWRRRAVSSVPAPIQCGFRSLLVKILIKVWKKFHVKVLEKVK